jgi:hypothetical protein
VVLRELEDVGQFFPGGRHSNASTTVTWFLSGAGRATTRDAADGEMRFLDWQLGRVGDDGEIGNPTESERTLSVYGVDDNHQENGEHAGDSARSAQGSSGQFARPEERQVFDSCSHFRLHGVTLQPPPGRQQVPGRGPWLRHRVLLPKVSGKMIPHPSPLCRMTTASL